MSCPDYYTDLSWCSICDRAIQPKRIQVPVLSPQSDSSLRNGRGGIVNGTGRGLRRHPSLQSHHPLKMRTVISQDPSPYYCSEECRLQDIQDELDQSTRLSHLSLYSNSDQDLDNDNNSPVLRVPPVPSNTPSDGFFHTPPSPLFLSSGTESDSSESTGRSYYFDDSASYSPAQALKSLPPLSSLNRKPSKKLEQPMEYRSGVMMAAQVIQQAFNTQQVSSSSSPHKRDVVIPGWTDGDRTQWRSSVYGGAMVVPNPNYRPANLSESYTGGSYTAQGPRRAAGLEDNPSRRCPIGQSAPQPRTLHERSLPFKRNTSSSQLSTDDGGSHSEESVHPLLSTPLQGKLLVPQIRSGGPSRSSSSQSLSSLKRDSVPAKSPLGRLVMLSNSSQDGASEARSWSYDGQFMFKLPPRVPRKEKRVQDVWVPSPQNQSGLQGLGEGKWEKREVEIEVQQERKRLFLFGG